MITKSKQGTSDYNADTAVLTLLFPPRTVSSDAVQESALHFLLARRIQSVLALDSSSSHPQDPTAASHDGTYRSPPNKSRVLAFPAVPPRVVLAMACVAVSTKGTAVAGHSPLTVAHARSRTPDSPDARPIAGPAAGPQQRIA